LTGDRLLVDHETLPSPFERSAPSLQLHGVTSDTKDVDLTIRLASEAEQATTIDDEEIERELRALVRDVEAEGLADKERAGLGSSVQLQRLREANVPTDVPEALGEPEWAMLAKEEEGQVEDRAAFVEVDTEAYLGMVRTLPFVLCRPLN